MLLPSPPLSPNHPYGHQAGTQQDSPRLLMVTGMGASSSSMTFAAQSEEGLRRCLAGSSRPLAKALLPSPGLSPSRKRHAGVDYLHRLPFHVVTGAGEDAAAQPTTLAKPSLWPSSRYSTRQPSAFDGHRDGSIVILHDLRGTIRRGIEKMFGWIKQAAGEGAAAQPRALAKPSLQLCPGGLCGQSVFDVCWDVCRLSPRPTFSKAASGVAPNAMPQRRNSQETRWLRPPWPQVRLQRFLP